MKLYSLTTSFAISASDVFRFARNFTTKTKHFQDFNSQQMKNFISSKLENSAWRWTSSRTFLFFFFRPESRGRGLARGILTGDKFEPTPITGLEIPLETSPRPLAFGHARVRLFYTRVTRTRVRGRESRRIHWQNSKSDRKSHEVF